MLDLKKHLMFTEINTVQQNTSIFFKIKNKIIIFLSYFDKTDTLDLT